MTEKFFEKARAGLSWIDQDLMDDFDDTEVADNQDLVSNIENTTTQLDLPFVIKQLKKKEQKFLFDLRDSEKDLVPKLIFFCGLTFSVSNSKILKNRKDFITNSIDVSRACILLLSEGFDDFKAFTFRSIFKVLPDQVENINTKERKKTQDYLSLLDEILIHLNATSRKLANDIMQYILEQLSSVILKFTGMKKIEGQENDIIEKIFKIFELFSQKDNFQKNYSEVFSMMLKRVLQLLVCGDKQITLKSTSFICDIKEKNEGEQNDQLFLVLLQHLSIHISKMKASDHPAVAQDALFTIYTSMSTQKRIEFISFIEKLSSNKSRGLRTFSMNFASNLISKKDEIINIGLGIAEKSKKTSNQEEETLEAQAIKILLNILLQRTADSIANIRNKALTVLVQLFEIFVQKSANAAFSAISNRLSLRKTLFSTLFPNGLKDSSAFVRKTTLVLIEKVIILDDSLLQTLLPAFQQYSFDKSLLIRKQSLVCLSNILQHLSNSHDQKMEEEEEEEEEDDLVSMAIVEDNKPEKENIEEKDAKKTKINVSLFEEKFLAAFSSLIKVSLNLIFDVQSMVSEKAVEIFWENVIMFTLSEFNNFSSNKPTVFQQILKGFNSMPMDICPKFSRAFSISFDKTQAKKKILQEIAEMIEETVFLPLSKKEISLKDNEFVWSLELLHEILRISEAKFAGNKQEKATPIKIKTDTILKVFEQLKPFFYTEEEKITSTSTFFIPSFLKLFQKVSKFLNPKSKSVVQEELLENLNKFGIPSSFIQFCMKIAFDSSNSDTIEYNSKSPEVKNLIKSVKSKMEPLVLSEKQGISKNAPSLKTRQQQLMQESKLPRYLMTIGELALIITKKYPESLERLVIGLLSLTSDTITSLNNQQPSKKNSSLDSTSNNLIAIRSHAFIALGKICLTDQDKSLKNLNLFLKELNHPSDVIRNNILVVISDLCVKFPSFATTTCLDHMCKLINFQAEQSILIRKNAISLLTQLLAEKYIKWNTNPFLFYSFLVASSDDCSAVSDSAKYALIYTSPLEQQAKKAEKEKDKDKDSQNDVSTTTFLQNRLIPSIFLLNNCSFVAEFETFANHSTVLQQKQKIIGNSGPIPKEKRLKIYNFLLSQLTLFQKLKIHGNLHSEVLSLISEKGRNELSSQKQKFQQPKEMDKNLEEVIRDILEILSSPDLLFKSVSDLKSSLIDTSSNPIVPQNSSKPAAKISIEELENEELDENADEIAEKTNKILFSVLKKHIQSNVVPEIIQLKNYLQELHSPLLGPTMEYLENVLKSYPKEIHEILKEDPQLEKELRFDMRKRVLQQKTQKVERWLELETKNQQNSFILSSPQKKSTNSPLNLSSGTPSPQIKNISAIIQKSSNNDDDDISMDIPEQIVVVDNARQPRVSFGGTTRVSIGGRLSMGAGGEIYVPMTPQKKQQKTPEMKMADEVNNKRKRESSPIPSLISKSLVLTSPKAKSPFSPPPQKKPRLQL